MATPRATVSVVVPCYNYGRYLAACLDSILAQTYPASEILVIDDGSTDDTEEVIQPFLSDQRVQFHRQTNRGQASAKNAGVARSTCDVVAFLDADDLWMPEKLARQMPLFDNPAVGVTFTGQRSIDADGRPMRTFRRVGHSAFRRGRVTRWLGFENIVPFSASAVRRQLFTECGGFDETLGMGIDWELWLRLSLVTEFDFVDDELFVYRLHSSQMSRNLAGRIEASEEIFRNFVAQHPSAFPPGELNAIAFYNACSRAHAYRSFDLKRSDELYVAATRLRRLSPAPYVGLMRNALQRWRS